MPNTIFTIGYSGYSIEEFIRELKAHSVSAVIDVRSTPFSEYFKDYDKPNFEKTLNQNRIHYRSYASKENVYIQTFNENISDYTDTKQVIRTLAIANAQTLARGTKFADGECVYTQEERDAIIEAADYLMERIPNQEKFMRAAYQNWPYGPRLLRLRDELITERLYEKCEAAYEQLDDSGQKNTTILFEYIWNNRTNRVLTFMFQKDSIVLEIQKTVPRKDNEQLKAELMSLISFLILDGGALVYRMATSGKDVINGFFSNEGRVIAIGEKELKHACELQPDGSIHHFDDQVYQRPFCKFV